MLNIYIYINKSYKDPHKCHHKKYLEFMQMVFLIHSILVMPICLNNVDKLSLTKKSG